MNTVTRLLRSVYVQYSRAVCSQLNHVRFLHSAMRVSVGHRLNAPRQILDYAIRSSNVISRRQCSSDDDDGEASTTSTSFNVQDYDDFQERVLQSDVPVVVDFHAEWCQPCRFLGPRLETIVDSRGGRIILAKVNVDDNSDVAADYGVTALPTVIAFDNGAVVDEFVGLQEEEQIQAFVNKLTDD